jgi:DNA repair protein RecO
MSHRIYTTPGFVVNSRPYGEGGKILFIFTAELGQVSAIAQGIRLSKSKLRYHAQDYSLANFSLVRGKDFWRVVGADDSVESCLAESTDGKKISTTNSAYVLQVRMLSVLSRLLQGEEKNVALFETVNAAYQFLGTSEAKDSAQIVEPIIMLRVLHHLGYVRLIPDLTPFLTDNSFTPELLASFAAPGLKSKAIKEINAALQESHL